MATVPGDDADNQNGKGVLNMENSPGSNTIVKPFLRRKGFRNWNRKPYRSNGCLELLAHYDAELKQTAGLIVIIRYKTGTELPLERKGRLQMVKLLLEEFGTVDEANRAIANYKISHS